MYYQVYSTTFKTTSAVLMIAISSTRLALIVAAMVTADILSSFTKPKTRLKAVAVAKVDTALLTLA